MPSSLPYRNGLSSGAVGNFIWIRVLSRIFHGEHFGEEAANALAAAAEERHVEGFDPPLDEHAREIEEKVTLHAFGHGDLRLQPSHGTEGTKRQARPGGNDAQRVGLERPPRDPMLRLMARSPGTTRVCLTRPADGMTLASAGIAVVPSTENRDESAAS